MIGGFLAGARRGLDNEVHRSWQDSLTATSTVSGRVLAWAAATGNRWCIAANGILSISSPQDRQSDRPDLGWQHIGWHRIERGGFDADSSALRWTLYSDTDRSSVRAEAAAETGLTGSVILPHPGRLPLVFRDRVGASIVVEQFIPLADRPAAPGRRLREPGVIISGRRDLGNRDAPIEWHASLPQGIGWDTPGIEELAAESVVWLRSEYDPNG